ncbi:hypothetical protein GCM10022409_39660 [Hymenobacter glaciei]|uniref:Uncharacterized protein n=1 Tax=Hymenobacter glaciei TaxID=877209 RepID=A0ABP7UPU3_9BACT
MTNDVKKILGYNLVALLGAAVVLRIFIRSEPAYYFSGYSLIMLLVIVLTTLTNIGCAVFTRVTGRRKIYLLGALLVPLIGFGVCAAGTQSIPRIERTHDEPESTESATAHPA